MFVILKEMTSNLKAKGKKKEVWLGDGRLAQLAGGSGP